MTVAYTACLKDGATAAFSRIILGVNFVFSAIYKINVGFFIPGVMHSSDGN